MRWPRRALVHASTGRIRCSDRASRAAAPSSDSIGPSAENELPSHHRQRFATCPNVHGRSRTCNLRLRRATLYPIELRGPVTGIIRSNMFLHRPSLRCSTCCRGRETRGLTFSRERARIALRSVQLHRSLIRTGGRAVERAGLENRYRLRSIVSSNLTLSVVEVASRFIMRRAVRSRLAVMI